MNEINKSALILLVWILFFNVSSTQDLPADNLRTPTSAKDLSPIIATEGSVDVNEYFVGPGDNIFLSISGVRELVYNLIINQEGWIYLPQVGGIDLNNLTLAQAKNKMVESINHYYKNVQIFISLIDFRIIKVSLLGDVKKPSSFIITANSRLMDLVSLSDELTETSNIRNIKIISKKNSTKIYDLLSFERFGNYAQNPLLREGDVVIVDRVDKSVTINGLIKYPGEYAYVKGESIYNLIQLAGGFLSTAKIDTIEVVRFYDNGISQKSEFFSLEELKKNEFLLQQKDYVIIREIPEYYIEYFVKIDGFVIYPGFYKIIKNKTTLKNVIEQAGGFLEEASLTEATLTRNIDKEKEDPEFERLKLINPADMTDDEYDYFKSKSRQTSGRVVIDFVDLFINNNLTENIVLRRGDVITIPEQKNYIIMLGQFINPGKIIYNPSLTIKDYIALAKGFGWRALEGEVRVIKATTGEWIDADDVVKLDPGDTIWVPEDPPGPKFWDVFMDGLQIIAQLATIVAATAAIIIATR